MLGQSAQNVHLNSKLKTAKTSYDLENDDTRFILRLRFTLMDAKWSLYIFLVAKDLDALFSRQCALLKALSSHVPFSGWMSGAILMHIVL